MNKKEEYLIGQIEKAISENNYKEVNTCYQELLKTVSPNEIAEITAKVSMYNHDHQNKVSENSANEFQVVKSELYRTTGICVKLRYLSIHSIIGGLALGLLGTLLCGMGEITGYYNDGILYTGLGIAIMGGILLMLVSPVSWIIFTKKMKCFLEEQKRIFDLICQNESKLQYIGNIEDIDQSFLDRGQMIVNKYRGQMIDNQRNGFGVAIIPNKKTGMGRIYVGEWKHNCLMGVGKLYSEDMSMVIEGEFSHAKIHGVVDITWDDGDSWHGEYQNDLPFNGQGKTKVNNKIQTGVWKNGVKVQ